MIRNMRRARVASGNEKQEITATEGMIQKGLWAEPVGALPDVPFECFPSYSTRERNPRCSHVHCIERLKRGSALPSSRDTLHYYLCYRPKS